MPRLHFDLGFLLWFESQFDEAETEFNQELRINPQYAPAAYYLGDIAFNRNDYSTALELFQKATTEDCACLCLDAFLGLGKAYFRLDQLQESLRHLEHARRLDSEQPDVQYWLSAVYRRLGMPGKSSEALERHQELMNKAKAAPAVKSSGLKRWLSGDCMNESK